MVYDDDAADGEIKEKKQDRPGEVYETRSGSAENTDRDDDANAANPVAATGRLGRQERMHAGLPCWQ